MGPLVPDVIGNELNFIIAIFIGIAFGFILEQAGFSTSKKLVGLFYGYDFTVLRVFFTGGVTAMIGVIILGHFGLLDLSLIYINPTFLWSAIVGGLIMGLGFVIGGFCPGTSITAAAIGKIDAMIFVLGSGIGVFIFAEGYPEFKPARLYAGLSGLAILIGLSAFVMPDIKDSYLNDIENINYVNNYYIKEMTSDELAFRLIDDDNTLQVIDIRPMEEFKELSLPHSLSFTLKNLFVKDARAILAVKHKKYVFVGEDGVSSKKAAIIADRLGYDNVSYLRGGLTEFKQDIINYKKSSQLNSREAVDTDRFRTQASKVIPVLIEKNKNVVIPVKKTKRVLGGC